MIGRSFRIPVLALVCMLVWAESFAQSRHAVFIHGFGAEASDWAATVDRLDDRVAMRPHTPSLPWRDKFETQAKSLQSRSEFSTLPVDTVAVGHSNGGIVAREWSKLHRLRGVATIGTPHRGVPLMANLPVWAAFTGSLNGLVNEAVSAFGFSSDWISVFAIVESALRLTSDFSVWSFVNLLKVLGVNAAMPVSVQMLPNSAYILGLSSFSTASREASQIPDRVGIVTVARNFYYGGPARGIAPNNADNIATAMYAAASTLLFWGNYILASAPVSDTDAIRQGLALIELAGQILAVDPTYCSMVSSTSMTTCVANDGLVPVTSQAYPGAPNLRIEGPAHRQQKQQSDDALYAALVTYMHLPRKTTTSPVPPSPAPPPPPSPAPAPAPGPAPAPAPDPDPDDDRGPVTITSGTLDADDRLRPGDMVNSRDGRLHLVYQADGNLVLYVGDEDDDDDWTALWASDTEGTSAGFAIMQRDGNFVVYDANERPRWSTGTFRSGSRLLVQNDGNVVVYDVDNAPLWATDTFVD